MAELTGNGNPGALPQGAGRQGCVLHHGRADARCRDVLHQGRHPPHRHRATSRAPASWRRPIRALTQRPGVCMAASGPATINFGTGLANALIDCCPVSAFGGSVPISQFGRQVFQEIDQVKALMSGCRQIRRPHAQRETHPAADQFRLPEGDERQARPGLPRFPGRRALCQGARGARSIGAMLGRPILRPRPYAEPQAINALVDAISNAEAADHLLGQRRPLVARLGRDARSSSRRPASRSTRPRRAAASCRTTTPIRT